jgi:hypothetical protein
MNGDPIYMDGNLLGYTSGGAVAAPLGTSGGTTGVTPVVFGMDDAAIASILATVVTFVASGNASKALSLVKTWFGSNWWKILVGAGAAGGISLVILGILGKLGGKSAVVNGMKVGGSKRRKRMSIGANPRLATLIKVAKRTDRITRMFAQRMRHAGLIHSQTRHNYPQIAYRGHNGAHRDLTVVR